MFEIELKAHVNDRNAVITKLNGFACYCGAVQKEDTYYALNGGKKCRLRTETPFTAPGQRAVENQQAHAYFTYKCKERRTSADGSSIEVNDEKECELTDTAPLTAYLTDTGFSVVLKKHKTVLGWTYENIHIELCTVPPLGDFLELETLADDSEPKTVQHRREALKAVLTQAGLSTDAIEDRYYSELLKLAADNTKEQTGETHV